MRLYMVYLDDNEYCYKVAIPARSEDEAEGAVAGNGDVVAIRDVTEDYRWEASELRTALEAAGYSRFQNDFLIRALEDLGLVRGF